MTDSRPSPAAFELVTGFENALREQQTSTGRVWDRRLYGAAANALGRVRRSYTVVEHEAGVAEDQGGVQ